MALSPTATAVERAGNGAAITLSLQSTLRSGRIARGIASSTRAHTAATIDSAAALFTRRSTIGDGIRSKFHHGRANVVRQGVDRVRRPPIVRNVLRGRAGKGWRHDREQDREDRPLDAEFSYSNDHAASTGRKSTRGLSARNVTAPPGAASDPQRAGQYSQDQPPSIPAGTRRNGASA